MHRLQLQLVLSVFRLAGSGPGMSAQHCQAIAALQGHQGFCAKPGCAFHTKSTAFYFGEADRGGRGTPNVTGSTEWVVMGVEWVNTIMGGAVGFPVSYFMYWVVAQKRLRRLKMQTRQMAITEMNSIFLLLCIMKLFQFIISNHLCRYHLCQEHLWVS